MLNGQLSTIKSTHLNQFTNEQLSRLSMYATKFIKFYGHL